MQSARNRRCSQRSDASPNENEDAIGDAVRGQTPHPMRMKTAVSANLASAWMTVPHNSAPWTVMLRFT